MRGVLEAQAISAEIIADSTNEVGDRITTFILTFPRYILAELNTHRVFSKNSASSRAIPFNRMLKMVQKDPFIPIAWQRDHKGMQGNEYFTNENSVINTTKARGYYTLDHLNNTWLEARNEAVKKAQYLNSIGVTKQLCNRLLEPFMWHTVILTATEWENFFKLRCPQYEIDGKTYRSMQDAFNDIQDVEHPCWNWTLLECLQNNKGQGEIHIMALAEAMWDAMKESKPNSLSEGEWHIPFGDRFDQGRLRDYFYKVEKDPDPSYDNYQMVKIKIATARCARISYLNFEGKDDYEADIKLHNRLLESGHFSPFEHCARAMSEPKWSGNFKGFIQYRKMIEQ